MLNQIETKTNQVVSARLKFGRNVVLYLLVLFYCMVNMVISCTRPMDKSDIEARIKPYTENPGYWQYKGQPVMLLGANTTDSPYLLADQEAYYDELAGLGGNFTRYNVKQRLDNNLVKIFPYKKRIPGEKPDI